MTNDYYINLNNYSLSDYANELEHAELLPSRKIIQEDTKRRFSLLNKEGIKTLGDVLTAFKTNDKLKAFSQKTKIPEDFLTILLREIKSMQPKPVRFSEIPAISKETIKKLGDLKINNTKDLFPFIITAQDRKSFGKKSSITQEEITELTNLTDVSRIKWVGANFARVLVDSNFNTVKKISKAEPKKLFEEITKVNENKKYYKGKIGLNDMKLCILAAKSVPDAIKY